MPLLILILIWLLISPIMDTSKTDPFRACLPAEISSEMIISEEPTPASSEAAKKPRTVRQKLVELKAHCKNDKLIDDKGKEIRFVQLLGCWGNPPEDYQEQLDRQKAEITKLKTKYTVIEIACAQPADLKDIH